jgi:hypothetical protein
MPEQIEEKPDEKKQTRDLAADQQLVMQDLVTGELLRHSLDPPVSDFTNAAGVPPDEVLSILNNWHNQGIVFSKIPNDNFDQDGVSTCWKLNWNGYMSMRARGQGTPTPVLTSISPASGVKATTVTITATGSDFSPDSYISVPGADVGTTNYVSDTQLMAETNLPNVPGTLQVTVVDETWGTVTDPQPFTVTAT